MANVENSDDIFTRNPYEGHPSLSEVESELLWEYAKLAAGVKLVTQRTRNLTAEPDKHMLARLRVLEKKMGLVLTLFKASVWGVINEQPALDPDNASYDLTTGQGEGRSSDRTIQNL